MDAGPLHAVPAAAHVRLSLDAVLPQPYRALLPYAELNAVQSRVFDAAVHSDASIAVAAPTGCGKTAVFDLAIVRLLLKRDRVPGFVDADAGAGGSPSAIKVVYLAPLKALCTERLADWRARFGRAPFHLRVASVTGDSDDGGSGGGGGGRNGGAGSGTAWGGDEDESGCGDGDGGGGDKTAASSHSASWIAKVSSSDILLTTPEKFDAATRRWRDNMGLIGHIALLCIDEVHTLGDGRGAVLEAVVSRMRAVAASPLIAARGWPAAQLRTVAVSATCPNLLDVGRWIGASPATIFSFGAEFRPVPLVTHVLPFESYSGGSGGGGSGGFLFEKYLDSRLFETLQRFASGRPALVFCASRNGVKVAAEALVKEAVRVYGAGLGAQAASKGLLRNGEAVARCAEASAQARDARLAECVRHGVGFHSAGMVREDRSLIEGLFLSGALPALCTTSTLSMGVNLPAHLVIIKSTQAWRGAGLNYQEYSTSSLLQMMGRAGRPQFDTSGVAVIMTHVSTAQRYQRISAGGEPVESTLLSSLVEHLASEICLGTVQSLSAATAWLRSTFLYIRVRSNPRHYKLLLPQQSGDLDAAVDQHMRTQLCTHLFALAKAQCVRLQPAITLPTSVSSSSSSALASPANSDAVPSAWIPTSAAALSQTAQQSGGELALAPLGPAFVMSRHYVSFPTLAAFSSVARDADVPAALQALCASPEIVSGLTLRRDEKRLLRYIKEKAGRVRAKTGKQGTVATPDDKAFQLAQVFVGRLKLEQIAEAAAGKGGKVGGGAGLFSLRMETLHVGNLLVRISKAFESWCVCEEIASPLLPIASALRRGLEHQLWPDQANEPGGRRLLQLEGITEPLLPLLVAQGLSTIEDLQSPSLHAGAINFAARKAGEWGAKIKAQAVALLPRLGLRVKQAGVDAEAGAAVLGIEIYDLSEAVVDPKLAIGGGAAQRSITDYLGKGLPASSSSASLTSSLSSSSAAFVRPAADSSLAARHGFTLCVTTADAKGGLVYLRPHLRGPGSVTVRVPRPLTGPNVQLHLLHEAVLGFDTRVTIKPTFPLSGRHLVSTVSAGSLSRSAVPPETGADAGTIAGVSLRDASSAAVKALQGPDELQRLLLESTPAPLAPLAPFDEGFAGSGTLAGAEASSALRALAAALGGAHSASARGPDGGAVPLSSPSQSTLLPAAGAAQSLLPSTAMPLVEEGPVGTLSFAELPLPIGFGPAALGGHDAFALLEAAMHPPVLPLPLPPLRPLPPQQPMPSSSSGAMPALPQRQRAGRDPAQLPARPVPSGFESEALAVLDAAAEREQRLRRAHEQQALTRKRLAAAASATTAAGTAAPTPAPASATAGAATGAAAPAPAHASAPQAATVNAHAPAPASASAPAPARASAPPSVPVPSRAAVMQTASSKGAKAVRANATSSSSTSSSLSSSSLSARPRQSSESAVALASWDPSEDSKAAGPAVAGGPRGGAEALRVLFKTYSGTAPGAAATTSNAPTLKSGGGALVLDGSFGSEGTASEVAAATSALPAAAGPALYGGADGDSSVRRAMLFSSGASPAPVSIEEAMAALDGPVDDHEAALSSCPTSFAATASSSSAAKGLPRTSLGPLSRISAKPVSASQRRPALALPHSQRQPQRGFPASGPVRLRGASGSGLSEAIARQQQQRERQAQQELVLRAQQQQERQLQLQAQHLQRQQQLAQIQHAQLAQQQLLQMQLFSSPPAAAAASTVSAFGLPPLPALSRTLPSSMLQQQLLSGSGSCKRTRMPPPSQALFFDSAGSGGVSAPAIAPGNDGGSCKKPRTFTPWQQQPLYEPRPQRHFVDSVHSPVPAASDISATAADLTPTAAVPEPTASIGGCAGGVGTGTAAEGHGEGGAAGAGLDDDAALWH